MWSRCVGFSLALAVAFSACERKEPASPRDDASSTEVVVDMNMVEVATPLAFPLVKAETRTVPKELSVNGTIPRMSAAPCR